MTTVVGSLDTELRLDFLQAQLALANARRRQFLKDTPERRSTVADRLARVDAVLDLYLDMRGDRS
jgi:hypothetical protein